MKAKQYVDLGDSWLPSNCQSHSSAFAMTLNSTPTNQTHHPYISLYIFISFTRMLLLLAGWSLFQAKKNGDPMLPSSLFMICRISMDLKTTSYEPIAVIQHSDYWLHRARNTMDVWSYLRRSNLPMRVLLLLKLILNANGGKSETQTVKQIFCATVQSRTGLFSYCLMILNAKSWSHTLFFDAMGATSANRFNESINAVTDESSTKDWSSEMTSIVIVTTMLTINWVNDWGFCVPSEN